MGTTSAGALNTRTGWVGKNWKFSTEIAVYLRNGARQAHGYYGTLIGSRRVIKTGIIGLPEGRNSCRFSHLDTILACDRHPSSHIATAISELCYASCEQKPYIFKESSISADLR